MLMPLSLVVLLAAQTSLLVDRTLAIVAGRTVTLSDARTALRLGLIDGVEVDRAVVQRLVDRELMLREADRYEPPEPEANRVAARLAEVTARAGGDDGLARVLRAGGFAEARLYAWIRDDFRIETYLRQRFAASERRDDLITDWLSDLRRRSPITVLEP